jgi:predicted O-methyltransferase YrrM
MKLADFQQEAIYTQAKDRLKPWERITRFIRNFTTDAATLVPDNSLDFIYVDARHDYCGTREDLHSWWPKLRYGGILAGHDYLSAEEVEAYGQTGAWTRCRDGRPSLVSVIVPNQLTMVGVSN